MALTSEKLEHYRRILTARRDVLAGGITRAESDVNDQVDLEHLDVGDRAAADTSKDDLLQQVSRDTGQTQEIETALSRIDDGTYGVCAVCGAEIPPARLDAVPWATLCVRDREKADQAQGGAPSRVTL